MDSWEVAGEPPLLLELLEMRHAEALERFERANRAYFTQSISDRGDTYFEQFERRLAALVEENRIARSLCFVLVSLVGEVIGRVNLYDIDRPERTELGFRVAESVHGKGVATRGVIVALQVGRSRGVRSVIARVSTVNIASRRVLEKCGFSPTGATESPEGSSRSFIGYRREL